MAGNMRVLVYIYDLSNGLARSMSMPLLGKQLDGVWHTGIVVYGEEFFFGGMGIEACPPGGTMLGHPNSIVDLGETEIPSEVFMEHLGELSRTSFRGSDYNLLNRNCNNFSSEIAQFLTGNDIPSYITNLPDEVMSSPLGAMLRPMLEAMSVNPGAGAHPIAQPNAVQSNTSPYPQSSATAEPMDHFESSEVIRYPKSEMKQIRDSGSDLLKEVVEYCELACDWSISAAHLDAIDLLLNSEDTALDAWSLFKSALLKKETVETMKRHKASKYFASLAKPLKNEIKWEATKSLCNLCSFQSGYRWAVSKSKTDEGSNHEVLQHICGGIMSDDPQLVSICAALSVNIAIHHEPQDDLHIIIASALVEVLANENLELTTVQRSLTALMKLMEGNQEIILLSSAMGLDLSKYKDTSALDSLCQKISTMQAQASC